MIKQRIIFLIVIIGVLSVIGIVLFRVLPEKLKTEITIPCDSLAAEYAKIGRVQIYYNSWELYGEYPFNLVSEKKFTSAIQFLKVEGGYILAKRLNIVNLLKDFPFKRVHTYPAYNLRYSCILQTYENKVFRISLAHGDPVTVLINGEPYEATPKIVDGLMKALPVVEYNKMHQILQTKGFFSDTNSVATSY